MEDEVVVRTIIRAGMGASNMAEVLLSLIGATPASLSLPPKREF